MFIHIWECWLQLWDALGSDLNLVSCMACCQPLIVVFTLGTWSVFWTRALSILLAFAQLVQITYHRAPRHHFRGDLFMYSYIILVYTCATFFPHVCSRNVSKVR